MSKVYTSTPYIVPSVSAPVVPQSQVLVMPKFNRIGNGFDRQQGALERFGRATMDGVLGGMGMGSLPGIAAKHPVYERFF